MFLIDLDLGFVSSTWHEESVIHGRGCLCPELLDGSR